MKIIVITFFILLVCFGGAIVLLNKQVAQIKSNYEKPDTTITVKNGKADTTIVTKKLPWWAK
jgi:uncharacterized protein YlzI (FlbEa/FlbD family)